jgi:hypothetical protein
LQKHSRRGFIHFKEKEAIMEHKNDYSAVVFFETGNPKRWTYVHKLTEFEKFINEKHSGWKYFNLYERRSGKYLKRFYKGNFIPHFVPLPS